ncbi:MAG: cytidine deaminase [Gammaproteobacteria bacterium]|jgi:cytidine deaminase|nr:cytidine deaminase [Gammaproteobacteria bacterium]
MQTSSYFDEMLKQALHIKTRAYAPYSHFHVGACFRSEDNTLYSGCNIENASYGLTLCAEAVALGKLVSAGKKRIVEGIVLGSGEAFCPPCGRCRQLIREFSEDDACIHFVKGSGKSITIKTLTISELLPFSFGAPQLPAIGKNL